LLLQRRRQDARHLIDRAARREHRHQLDRSARRPRLRMQRRRGEREQHTDEACPAPDPSHRAALLHHHDRAHSRRSHAHATPGKARSHALGMAGTIRP
jgi:hypothetical protein